MKTSQLAALWAAVCFAGVPRLHATDLVEPVGEFTSITTLVRTGTNPMLKWSIAYPTTLTDVVTVSGNTLTPKTDLTMEVRVIAASMKKLSDLGIFQSWCTVDCQFKYGTGAYTSIWKDSQPNVDSSKAVLTQTVAAGKSLDFGGRYYTNGLLGTGLLSSLVSYWSTLHTTENSAPYQVVALKNGDTVPCSGLLSWVLSLVSLQTSLESYLKPYVDDAGKVSIGPKDVIYLMELNRLPTLVKPLGLELGDYQDLVLLVTFKTP
ncbi:MAG: hypothetical protein QM680_14425 [Luteolibacter sp.]